MKKYPVITISREYGSGGREIGKKLSEQLELPFYDYEIVSLASQDSRFAEEMFDKAEVRSDSAIKLALSRLSNKGTYKMPLDDQLFMIQSGIIRTIADRGPAVIVGRCADFVLRDYAKCIHIFVQADFPFRVKEAMKRNNLSETEAIKYVRNIDKRRATYYNYYSDHRWGKREDYDLCISSSAVGIKVTTDIIHTFVENWISSEKE